MRKDQMPMSQRDFDFQNGKSKCHWFRILFFGFAIVGIATLGVRFSRKHLASSQMEATNPNALPTSSGDSVDSTPVIVANGSNAKFPAPRQALPVAASTRR